MRLTDELRVSISIENGVFDIVQEMSREDLFLDQSASYNAKESIRFSSFFELEDIQAETLTAQGNAYATHPVESFSYKDELTDSFYDDVRSVNFVFPNLKQGSKTRLKYRQRLKDPRFLGAFYFGDFDPIENSRLTVEADADIELDFIVMNGEGVALNFEKKEGRKRTTYTWTLQESPAFEYEDQAPSYRSILPHVIPIIRSYTRGEEKVPVLGGVADLYKWYYSLVKDVNQAPADPRLEELVASLTEGKTSDLEKVRALYYWTQENIKYIAFEYALGGFIPREANDIFQKRYGDCKDNTSLLQVMLELAGLPGHITWIGTREIPYSYEEVPSPVVDNHMILAYKEADQTYFLDATGRYTPLEFPTAFIQGKEALIGISEDSFLLEKVPVIPPDRNLFRDRATLRLEADKLLGTGVAEITGYPKADAFYALEQLRSQQDVRTYYNEWLRKGNNSFLISHLEEENKYSYDAPFRVRYDFEISNYARQLGGEVYVNMNLDRPALAFAADPDREAPLEVEFQRTFESEWDLLIPEGFRVEYLPESFEVKHPLADVSISYTREAGHIRYRHHLQLKFLELPLEAQKELGDLVKNIEKQYREVVVLRKTE